MERREGVAVLQVDLVLVGAEALWILPDCFTSDPLKSGKESSTCRKAKLSNYMSLWAGVFQKLLTGWMNSTPSLLASLI